MPDPKNEKDQEQGDEVLKRMLKTPPVKKDKNEKLEKEQSSEKKIC